MYIYIHFNNIYHFRYNTELYDNIPEASNPLFYCYHTASVINPLIYCYYFFLSTVNFWINFLKEKILTYVFIYLLFQVHFIPLRRHKIPQRLFPLAWKSSIYISKNFPFVCLRNIILYNRSVYNKLFQLLLSENIFTTLSVLKYIFTSYRILD